MLFVNWRDRRPQNFWNVTLCRWPSN